MNPTIRAQIETEFFRVIMLARNKFPAFNAARIPTLTFFVKGRAAGVAKYTQWEISINEYLASQNMEMIMDTISHEVAHIVAYFVYGDRGHGWRWKSVHRTLGGTGERCYNAEENNVKPIMGRRSNWYMYACPNTGIESWIGPKFHNGLQNGKYSGLRNVAKNIPIRREHFTGKSELRG